MYKQFLRFAVLLMVCALAVVTVVQAQKSKNKAGDGVIKSAAPKTSDPGKCKGPRPPDRGCKIVCKPCFISVCENGKWIFQKLVTPKEECIPAPRDESGACKIGATAYCPPDCRTCVRQ